MGEPSHKGVLITVKPCEHCLGSGAIPSDALINEIQNQLDRGRLDGDDLIAISRIISSWPRRMNEAPQP